MAFFLPATFQKRLFRYALSQLTFLDMAAFDLDRLEGAWGSKSTGEIRDIPFKLDKLSELLSLPSWVKITTAKVRRLRLTVPVAIWRDGIEVEIDGVEISCRITGDEQKDKGLQRGVKANQPRSTQPRKHDPGGDQQGGLPSIEAMAQSFVEHEPEAEKEEVRTALAKQQGLESSQVSTSSSGEDEGVAPTYSLPGVAANFLWDVGERLRIAIKNIRFEIEFSLEIPTPGSISSSSEPITLRLTVDSLDINGAGVLNKQQSPDRPGTPTGNHRAVIANVQGFVISDASLFSTFSAMSVPPSPTTTHASTFRRDNSSLSAQSFPEPPSPERRSVSPRPSSMSDSQDIAMSRSTILDAPPDMFRSMYGGDAATEQLNPAGDQDPLSESLASSKYHGFGSEAEISQFEDYSSPDQSFLENGRLDRRDSFLGPLADSDTLPLNGYSQGPHKSQRPQTPTQEFPGTASVLSGASSSGPPPSQLLQRTLDEAARREGMLEMEASMTGESVFHDFADEQSPENQLHESFHESRSRTGSSVAEARPTMPLAHEEVETDTADPSSSESAIATPVAEYLTQSTIFTSDQAQSMYMSMIDETAPSSSRHGHIPGSWDSEYESGSSNAPIDLPLANAQMAPQIETSLSQDGAIEAELLHSLAGEASRPHASDSNEQNLASLAESSPSLSTAIRKRFLHIDKASFEVPPQLLRPPSNDNEPLAAGSTSNYRARRMPGEISMYDTTQSRLERSTMRASITAARQESFGSERDDEVPPPVIDIDAVDLANDMGLTKLVIMSVQQLLAARIHQDAQAPTENAKSEPVRSWCIRVDHFKWAFVETLPGFSDIRNESNAQEPLEAMNDLLVTHIYDFSASQRPRGDGSIVDASMGKYTFGYKDDPILSFDSSVKMRESVRDILAPSSKDVSVSIRFGSRAPPDVTIMTLPVHVVLDLRRLDETFSWFGGLSVMLGLGNSVMSTTTITEYKPIPKATKVRFETPASPSLHEEKLSPDSKSAKLTARIGGVLFDLHGKSSSLRLEGSALKLVNRTEGIGMRIDRLRFTGPITRSIPGDPAVAVNFGPLSIEFLQSPKEQDLARLIGLLSPSSQREDNEEDDILIETLLRQRRKGSLLRLNIERVKGDVQDLTEMYHFSLLADEMKQLATVTKYLPEDDRPGIMILSLIEEVDIGIEANKQFGHANLKLENIELALVTMPYLLLLGLDSGSARHGDYKLMGEVLQQKRRERRGKSLEVNQQRTPMLLVKFIGNDLEPTFKVRFWNLMVEYHVTTIMAAMGIEQTASGEVVVAEMVHSVANLARSSHLPKASTQSSGVSDTSTSIKPLKVDIGLRDCVVALNPLQKPSRGLLLLTSARISAAVPRGESSELETSIDLKQSSFMVINDVATLVVPGESTVPGLTFPPTYGSGHKLALQKMGYIHTADISSARIGVKMSAKDSQGNRTMDLEIVDKLFVIESCADSTQTMISILGGLSPPMPPSTDLKYRTEIEPVQDMIASFTGDAFVADEDPASTYEKIEKSHAEEPFEYDNSPTESISSDSTELAQKLGYDLPDGGNTAEAALRTEGKGKAPVRVKLNFTDKFFVQKKGWDGKAQEWDSTGNVYNQANPEKIRNSPLRVKVRDLHIIWNLFDGYDWQHTRDVIGDAVAEVERKAAERQARRTGRRSFEAEEEEDSVIGDFLFNSIYIGVGAKNDPRDLARQVNRNLADDVSESDSYATPTTVISATPSGRAAKTRRRRLRLDRSKHHKITFELKGVSADVVVFPPDSGETQNSIDLRVRDLEVYDHIHTSTWKKFATYMHDAGPRETDMPMVHVELLNVKPIAELAASEIVMRLSVLPLRLHVDQDALDFITRFFEFKDTSKSPDDPPATPGEQPFLQRVEVNAIPVKLDFKPKRVDYAGLRSGRTTEFMNFIVLEGSDLVLEHVIIYGISGFERLGKTLNDIWTPDVKANQLPGVLAGLAPVRGIVNVGSGIKDLVVVPMREYRKDGRLVRAIQKGAVTFAKTTTTELAKLGARLALGTQTVLQNAEGMLVGASGAEDEIPGNIATTAGADDEATQHISPYADQPLGVLAGVKGAWRHLERDLLLTRDAIIAVPGEIREGGSAHGAAKAVLRAAPTVILRPAMGVSRAAGTMLMGATNALDRQERRRTEDKYKRY